MPSPARAWQEAETSEGWLCLSCKGGSPCLHLHTASCRTLGSEVNRPPASSLMRAWMRIKGKVAEGAMKKRPADRMRPLVNCP